METYKNELAQYKNMKEEFLRQKEIISEAEKTITKDPIKLSDTEEDEQLETSRSSNKSELIKKFMSDKYNLTETEFLLKNKERGLLDFKRSIQYFRDGRADLGILIFLVVNFRLC